MNFEQQVVQADLISTETLITSKLNPSNPRTQVDEMCAEDLDRLPFGAIQLDSQGKILQYNDYESGLSGVKKTTAIGKSFFTDMAPCTNVREFYGRFQDGVAKKSLHEKFRYHFSFKINPVDVTVTLFYSGITNTVWVFVRPA